jgi:dihydrofolate reductase
MLSTTDTRKDVRMRNVVAVEWMSLDGVVQAPGHPDEDRDGGFSHGGWHLQYFDDESRRWVEEGYGRAGGFIFGRRTYENLAAYWPNASKEEQSIARPLNTLPKYVASRSPMEPLEWHNSSRLEGDVAGAVAALKKEEGGDLHLVGSSELARTLIEADVVDGYRLMIDPLFLGGGKRFFADDGTLRSLQLVERSVTSTGAILATYMRSLG